jgi:hypothetical protein
MVPVVHNFPSFPPFLTVTMEVETRFTLINHPK